ncbi:BZ3500_MvSof-1268-A1-R1_Chr9g10610 [Microbotryum saponariae]|uniref:DNA replication licensing factor MCM5 n=1 Tax=Microbotryum saponariae TaxID=289078 RepID=A0A2X0L1G7_9BASI|nr:BZ3501_MvSof-1269-A2-R1_Chr9g10358 [Microbotryum saponariae]SDA00384.1 BZ3500_MvSof-1268-A1-R1_Chr9g10610 [Microbotryum saponariae]
MSGFDQGSVYAVPVLPPASTTGGSFRSTGSNTQQQTNTATIKALQDFLTGYRENESFIYRDRLRANLLRKEYTLEVEVSHLIGWNEDLAARCRTEPGEVVPLFEVALRNLARAILQPTLAMLNPEERDRRAKETPEIQLQLRSGSRLMQFRELGASSISRLVRLPGIVISASVLSSRAIRLHLTCKSCRHVAHMEVQGGFTGFQLPRVCGSNPGPDGPKECPMDPYVIVHDKCTFVDQQTIKLQEAPDMVPVGELPRHVLLSADRYLTGKVVPGTRVIATGIYSTFQSGKSSGRNNPVALRTPYLRVIGLEIDTDGKSGSRNFTAEEEEEFGELARSDNFYERFASSVAPSIFGNGDIKKAVACLLFGGSKKVLPDGMRLRGDINVLLLGDPGTAKSQLLKFVEKVSPIAVYTSGKGSSAAGLTASVQRDPQSREFYLEGGAMVLADGGVVCIDEFDKMRDEDRVAIHEAMEQQTISIAKAGITTILNSRTSVLAAANPVFGRYDDMKTPGENIDFQTTILSRFDMIFIVKDEHDENRDRTIARHVMNLHMNVATESAVVGEIDIDKMKRFVGYCKSRCAPRLSRTAAEKLSSHFVALRKQVQQVERDNNERSSIPITVRQLEAIIRISESLAKMTLATQVQEHHVDEAIRLFKFSTMDAVQAGNVEGMNRGDLMEEINKVESDIRRRLPIGWSTSYASLVREFVTQQGYTQHALERTLYILERREVIRFSGGKKTVHRIGV